MVETHDGIISFHRIIAKRPQKASLKYKKHLGESTLHDPQKHV